MSLRAFLLSTTILSGALIAPRYAHAADLVRKEPTAPLSGPAVDGFNAKIDGFGGSASSNGIYGGRGSVSAPLGYSFGVQLDGAAGQIANRGFGTGAGHLFWRDPSRGLIGVFGSHTTWNSPVGNVRVNQVGAEGEAYFGMWSVQGVAGIEFGNSVAGTVGPVIQTFTIPTRFTDQINLNY